MSDSSGKQHADYRERIYERYAGSFQDAGERFDERAAARWGRLYDWHLRGWLPPSKEAAILDAGCGAGGLLFFYKTRGYMRLSGVDISPDQVRLARQVVPEVSEANALDYLEAHKDSFDMISALDIIEHLRKEEVLRFLEACRCALRSDGRLILQTPNAESPYGMGVRYGDFTHEICLTPDALRRLLSLCGFTSVALREQGPVPWGYSLRSSARYIVWQGLRSGLKLWNLAETGGAGSGVFSRVFLATALRGG